VSLKKEDYVDTPATVNTRNLFENLDSDQMILQNDHDRRMPKIAANLASAGNQVSYLFSDNTLLAFGNKYGIKNHNYPLVMNMASVDSEIDHRILKLRACAVARIMRGFGMFKVKHSHGGTLFMANLVTPVAQVFFRVETLNSNQE
jgi:hypothetical protein